MAHITNINLVLNYINRMPFSQIPKGSILP